MQLAGLMIEYLVIGSTALVPLIVLANSFDLMEHLKAIPTPLIAALIPALYCYGLIVDSIGRRLVNKHRIEEELQQEEEENLKKGSDKIRSQQVHVDILASKPIELAHQLQMRSSRDRLARGTYASVIILSIAVVVSLFRSHGIAGAIVGLIIGGVASFSCYRIWRRFQRLTARYEVFIDRAIKKYHEAS
jgi:hypothetical protein